MKIHAPIIVQLRHQHGWSQQQLADICGLSLRTIQRVENTGTASLETRKALAAAFHKSHHELLVSPAPADKQPSPKQAPPHTRFFRRHLKQASLGILATALISSVVLTSATTAAPNFLVEAKKMQFNTALGQRLLEGEVTLVLPDDMEFTLSPTSDARESEYTAVLTTPDGKIRLIKPTIDRTDEGIRIQSAKALWTSHEKAEN